MNITDEMLLEAAPEAAERWLSTLPEREDCGHDFSLTFQAAMKPLLRPRRRRWRTLVLLAAAVAALAGLLAFGVSADRPDDYGVYAAQGEGYVSYLIRPKEDSFDQTIHQLTPEWVPEGFLQDSASLQENFASMDYCHRTAQNQRFTLDQWHGKESFGTFLGSYELESIQMGGSEAILISSQAERTSYLLWTQGSDAFLLHTAGMEQEDLLRVAESLKW